MPRQCDVAIQMGQVLTPQGGQLTTITGVMYHGRKFSTGFMEPGVYDFGRTSHIRTIGCLYGALTINGLKIDPDCDVVIEPGLAVVVIAKEKAGYRSTDIE